MPALLRVDGSRNLAGEWRAALESSELLDLGRLREIHKLYWQGKRRDEAWRQVVEEARTYWHAELRDVAERARYELEPLTKAQVLVVFQQRQGYTPQPGSRWATKQGLIDDLVRQAQNRVEGEVSRARALWAERGLDAVYPAPDLTPQEV